MPTAAELGDVAVDAVEEDDQFDEFHHVHEDGLEADFGALTLAADYESLSNQLPGIGEESDSDDEGPHQHEFVIGGHIHGNDEDGDEDDDIQQPSEPVLTNSSGETGPAVQASAEVSAQVTAVSGDSTVSNSSGVHADALLDSLEHNSGDDDSDTETADPVFDIPMDQVEQLVAMRMRQLDRDYSASMAVDISQPFAGLTTAPAAGIRSGGRPSPAPGSALAGMLAARPDLAAKVQALHQMAASMALGSEAAGALGAASSAARRAGAGGLAAPQPQAAGQWETFDFPDDYGDLQAADSEAIRKARSSDDGPESGSNAGASQDDAAAAAGFDPFPPPPSAAAPSGGDGAGFNTAAAGASSIHPAAVVSLAVKGSSLVFVGDGFDRATKGKGKVTASAASAAAGARIGSLPAAPPSSSSASTAASAGSASAAIAAGVAQVEARKATAKLPPVRPVSPLRSDTRDAISSAMSRIKINPRIGQPGGISPWAEQLVQQALDRGKKSIAAHQVQQQKGSGADGR